MATVAALTKLRCKEHYEDAARADDLMPPRCQAIDLNLKRVAMQKAIAQAYYNEVWDSVVDGTRKRYRQALRAFEEWRNDSCPTLDERDAFVVRCTHHLADRGAGNTVDILRCAPMKEHAARGYEESWTMSWSLKQFMDGVMRQGGYDHDIRDVLPPYPYSVADVKAIIAEANRLGLATSRRPSAC